LQFATVRGRALQESQFSPAGLLMGSVAFAFR
jgi:hypothetical protein